MPYIHVRDYASHLILILFVFFLVLALFLIILIVPFLVLFFKKIGPPGLNTYLFR